MLLQLPALRRRRPPLSTLACLFVAVLGLLLISPSASASRSMMIPNVVYKYALLTAPVAPFNNSSGQDLVIALPEVKGVFTGASEQTGNINSFDNMPLASDVGGISGILVDYGNGCPFPAFPYLPATATHIALLNITQGDPACDPRDALQRTLDRMAQNNGTGLIALGDKDDPAIKLLAGASYSHQFPAYLFQDKLGKFLLDVMKSTNSTDPPFLTVDPAKKKPEIMLVPNAPFPANFSDPKSPDGLVHIGVRIDIDDDSPVQFPPIWRFAVVSLGIFFAFSVPAVFFLRWRAARYAQQFPPGQAPAPPATIDAAALVKKHPVVRFGSVMERYNGEPTCSICIDEFESDTNVRVLQPCGHAFHPECVDRWVMEQAAVCPMCRHDLLGEDGGVATTAGIPVAADQSGRPLAAPARALPRSFWRRLLPRRMRADDAQVLPTTTQQAQAPQRRSTVTQRDANGNAPWWKALLHNRSLPRATRDAEAARSSPAENLSVDIPLQNRTVAAAPAASPRAPPPASTAA
ncbi:hypothetical protein HDU88_005053 [Geranomyces variabilis]|nr:hypothetical protein HDU88_005053 [Geranomyces variabilis]